jgi:putative transcriptional regulator
MMGGSDRANFRCPNDFGSLPGRVARGGMAMSLQGSLLVAQPDLIDPNFRRTVVLILAHNEGGAFGLVINRPVNKEGLPFPIFHGGPCHSPGLLMLHGHADWVHDTSETDADGDGPQREVAPGVYLGDAECLKKAKNPADDENVRFRAYQGYAGWGPGQLEKELKSGSWQVTPADSALLFETPAESLWRLLGPPRIPVPSVN